MAIGVHTLVDAIQRNSSGDEQTKMLAVVDMMARAAPEVEDAVWVPSNNNLSHRVKQLVGLPEATWRRLYQGVQPSKATYATVMETAGILTSASEIITSSICSSMDSIR